MSTHSRRSGVAARRGRGGAHMPEALARTRPRRRVAPTWGARGRPVRSLTAAARGALARVPTAAWACALVAFLNAVSWSLITPPFLGLDEQDHFAYVQHIAESGQLPSSSSNEYSPEELLALNDLRYGQVRFRPEGHTIFAVAEQQKLQSDLARSPSRSGEGVGVAATEPPLYYMLQTIPYALGARGSILDRLELMRLLSAALAALTALFVFLFLREALPAARWAQTVGGLGIAFAPLFGYASSTVNPDALLFTVTAALLYGLTRAFRRGLSRRAALAIGVLIAVGLLTKLNFVGLAPGALLGLTLLARRQAQAEGPAVYYRSLAPAVLIALSPGLLYGLVNLASGHQAFGIVSRGFDAATSGHGSIGAELSYMWQFYLPRLPFMHNDFGEIFTTRQIWFRNVVGLYGWGDTPFPRWVYDVALIPAGIVAALCLRALVMSRAALRTRAAEVAIYGLMTLGLLALVAAASYTSYPAEVAEFSDARYLLPLLALWGAVLALAARGAGRRWGPVAGALIVVLVFAHDIFSQLQVIARFYG